MPSTLNPRYTFPSYVVGRSNEAAYSAVSAAAVSPGRLYNPILIAGATGLGKTHLAHAVTAEAALRGDRRVALISADEFLRHLADAVATGAVGAFVGELASAQLVVIDDVHVLDRHAAAQDALASLAERVVAAEHQLLLTSDSADRVDALATRLVRRFRSAHLATLGTPDWSHRVAILHAKATTLGIEMPPSVAHHLAAQCEGSVRELEGGMKRLLALAELEGAPLTLALARRAMPMRRREGPATLGAQEVQDAVAAEWGVSPEALAGPGRSRALAEPRRIGMLLCRDLLALSLREIGAAFGDRDVSTVLSALDRARGDVVSDSRIAGRVRRLREILSNDANIA